MLLKCFIWYVRKFWKTAMATELERSVFIPIPKKGNDKECSNYWTIEFISHANKVMLKILGFSNAWMENFHMYNLSCKEAEKPENKLPTFVGSWRKQGSSRKTSTFASLTTLKPLTMWITRNWSRCLLKFLCFLCDPTNIANLIAGSSAFSKSNMYMWNFSVDILLNPSLKDFEHNFASMWTELNCMVVWTFFIIALLWDWNENTFCKLVVY